MKVVVYTRPKARPKTKDLTWEAWCRAHGHEVGLVTRDAMIAYLGWVVSSQNLGKL